MRAVRYLAFLTALFLMTGCGTTDQQMQEDGRSQAFIDGFHDGSHSGMKEEGNAFEKYVRDDERYSNDPEYRAGWDAGEAEGKANQDTATAIGTGIAIGAGEGHSSHKSVTHDAEEVLKHTDTTGMDALGK